MLALMLTPLAPAGARPSLAAFLPNLKADPGESENCVDLEAKGLIDSHCVDQEVGQDAGADQRREHDRGRVLVRPGPDRAPNATCHQKRDHKPLRQRVKERPKHLDDG